MTLLHDKKNFVAFALSGLISSVFHFRRALPYAIDLSLSGSFQSNIKAESLE